MRKKAIFLFDTTGYAAEPFTKAGWITYIIDTANVGPYATNERATHVLAWDILKYESEIVELCRGAEFVFGFPPVQTWPSRGRGTFARKLCLTQTSKLRRFILLEAWSASGKKQVSPGHSRTP